MMAERFAAEMGLASLHVKREDLSHPTCGGNKVRGLEFILAQALHRRAHLLITLGAVGSHHVCRTAWHARALGLKSLAVVVPQPVAEYGRRNILLARSAAACYHHASFMSAGPRLVAALLNPRHWRRGRPPSFVSTGGSSPRACLGHVNAAFELAGQIAGGQLPEPDYVYVPMGSLGTAAGLALGLRLAGLRTRVVGVVVSYRWYATARRAARLARRTERFVRRHGGDVRSASIQACDIEVVEAALGQGYGEFTEESVELAERLHRCEGLMLDGTYTAKTLAGMMWYIRAQGLNDRRHLFWHTYQALPPPRDEEADVVLTPALRRYFEEPRQPLDERMIYP
jgi:D-cysteine desulfhydrase